MDKMLMALFLTSISSMPLIAEENLDSLSTEWDKMFELNEVVIVGKKPVLKQEPDKIVYLIQNDPYAKALNGIEVLDRIPRVSVINENVTVAGKSSVKYILDGHLMETTEEAILLQLRNIPSGNIEKIELLSTPPAKYASSSNVAFISITTKNESLATRGNVWSNCTLQEKFTYRLGASLSHTTRKIEFSTDAGWQSVNGINQLDRNFKFNDFSRISNRTTHFNDKNLGANAIFKYKFNYNISAGAIINFITDRFKSNLDDITIDNELTYNSKNYSPAKPNNALTTTLFTDWEIDNKGKLLSLTYNYVNKDTKTESNVITSSQNNTTIMQDLGHNKYVINSIKLDALIPFSIFK